MASIKNSTQRVPRDHAGPVVAPAPLPVEVRVRDGGAFSPKADVWAFRTATSTLSFNFQQLPDCSVHFVRGLKAALVWYAEHRSAHSMFNMFNRMKHLLKHLSAGTRDQIVEITAEDILNYRASLSASRQFYLSSLAGFLRRWRELGYPGVSTRAIDLLDDLRLRGNIKGAAVRTLDPHNGPYSDIELEAIQEATVSAYATGRIELSAFVVVWLFMLLGARPSQIALLKVADFSVVSSTDGTQVFTLRVPRVKQRGPEARQERTERIIAPQIGSAIEKHIAALKSFPVSDQEKGQMPLFPAERRDVSHPSAACHLTPGQLGSWLAEVVADFSITSERTGKLLHVSATRFRRTLGTRAAMEGHGELIIAELLDHTDTQNVGVYVEARPDIVDRIDKAVALKLAPMAQAFAGLLVLDEVDAERCSLWALAAIMGSAASVRPSLAIRVARFSLGSMAHTRRCWIIYWPSGTGWC
jgi:integrase